MSPYASLSPLLRSAVERAEKTRKAYGGDKFPPPPPAGSRFHVVGRTAGVVVCSTFVNADTWFEARAEGFRRMTAEAPETVTAEQCP